MFEIEQMEQKFDYSLVDNETADFLRSCEYEMNGIAEDARVKFGGVLIKAQDKLAKKGYGVFKEWVVSGGISIDDAYYYINLNRTSRNLDERKQDNFLKAPKSLQKEVMKKNVPEELKEKVFDGDVTTHKEYKELLEAKRQAESQAEVERKERERLEREVEELANQEPERIEVVPDDYDYIKGNYESAISLRDRYKEQLEEMRRELESSDRKQELNDSELERLKRKEEKLKSKINYYEKLFDIQTNLDMILAAIQPKMHSLKTENISNDFGIVDEVDSTLDEVIRVCNELKNKLPNKNIIEGEIINDI